MNIYIMRGIPGSGKSHLAKQLSEQFKAKIVSADDYFIHHGKYLFDRSLLGKAHISCQSRFEAEIGNRRPVVVDNTNTTFKEIGFYLLCGHISHYDMYIVEPDTPWKYNINECYKRNTHNVPIDSIKRMRSRWQSNKTIIQKAKNVGIEVSIWKPSS